MAMRTAIPALGVTSELNTLRLNSTNCGASARPSRKKPTPATSPKSPLSSASPAAIRRAMPASAPTSRTPANRRSRLSPPNRTAAATKMPTGSSRTTKMMTTSRNSTGLSGSLVPLGSPKWSRRTTVPWSTVRLSLPA